LLIERHRDQQGLPTASFWTPKVRVPIDPATSGADHFIPGLGSTRQPRERRVTWASRTYFFPDARLHVLDLPARRGLHLVERRRIDLEAPRSRLNKNPMALSWIADTNQGRMVGDYISTSFSDGIAVAGLRPGREGLRRRNRLPRGDVRGAAGGRLTTP
jgi:hypothetical protein